MEDCRDLLSRLKVALARSRFLVYCFGALLGCGFLCMAETASAIAANLMVINATGTALSCDGLPTSIPNGKSKNLPVLGSVSISCGGLSLYSAPSPSASPAPVDASYTVAVTGHQSRVLRVSLFPYLPSYPPGDLSLLRARLSGDFARQYPDVALEVTTDIDVYKFPKVRWALGAEGSDVVEIDTSILAPLESLIVPVPAAVDPPLPFAASAVKNAGSNGLFWGVPTWICRDFLFGYDPRLKRVRTLPQLLTFWRTIPSPSKVLGDFTGHFQLYAMYLNAYVARYGDAPSDVDKALKSSPDPAVISDLVQVIRGCAPMAYSKNPCGEGVFHNDAPDSTIESLFASRYAATAEGFSERSFYIELWNSMPPIVIPMPYGPKPVPLMYVDALVTNRSRCSVAPCLSDAQNLASYMTRASSRSVIALSEDLVPIDGSFPPRHLLPATASFYDLGIVKSDPIYSQIIPLLSAAKPMPTDIDEYTVNRVSAGVCGMLQSYSDLKLYGCDPTPPTPPPSTASHAATASPDPP